MSNYFPNLGGEKRGSEKQPRFKPIQLPQRLKTSFDSEWALLGSLMLIDSQDEVGMTLARRCIAMVSQAQFLGEYEQVAFNTISKLIDEGHPHAAWLVMPIVANHFGVDEAEVCATVLGWLDSVPSPLYAEKYAESVIARWQEREIINSLNEFGTRVEGGADVFAERQLLNDSLAKIAEVGAVTSLEDWSIDKLFDKALAARNQPEATAIGSGLPALDNIIKGGAKGGQLIVVAARPSHGKSVIGCQWAYTAAMRSCRSMILAYEMKSDEVIGRIMNMASLRVDEEFDVERFRSLQSYCPECIGWNISRVELECEAACKSHGVRLIVVDQLSLIAKRDEKLELRQHYIEVTRRLKQLAMRLDVPIILLAQLNRKIEERDSKVPNFHDLAESGSIEQDADIIVMMWRDEQSKIYVTKQRNGGQTGVVNVMVHPSTGKFVELAEEREVPGWDG